MYFIVIGGCIFDLVEPAFLDVKKNCPFKRICGSVKPVFETRQEGLFPKCWYAGMICESGQMF